MTKTTVSPPDLDQLDEHALRALVRQLMGNVEHLTKDVTHLGQDNQFKDAHIRKLTHEIAVLRRHYFGKKSEQLTGVQGSLLDEAIDEDIAAIEQELLQLQEPPVAPSPAARQQAKRQRLPEDLPRVDIHHEPEQTQCSCGCQLHRIGQDVSEKLDYQPGNFTVERHIRGKWACRDCEQITLAPLPAHIIDKGIPTPGLLAQVLVAKYADHLPLYRQEQIFARAGVKLARSTLAEWVGVCGVRLQPLVDALRRRLLEQAVLHADETPVLMLQPGQKNTKRAYLWAYASSDVAPLNAVIYDFTEGRAGKHARRFFGDWQGHLVCDDYTGYKACFTQGITEVGCMAHARRKFFDLQQANQSQLVGQALQLMGQLYEVERQAKDYSTAERLRLRQQQARPIADALHAWMQAHRQKVPDNTGIARALDYSLKRWVALTRYLDDGNLPIDNNRIENQIRPIAIGRKNWLFAGSLRAGQRAAAVMSLIQSAKLNGHDPYAYLKDVLMRLPTQLNSDIEELLPHQWQPVHCTN
jgi:transposase